MERERVHIIWTVILTSCVPWLITRFPIRKYEWEICMYIGCLITFSSVLSKKLNSASSRKSIIESNCWNVSVYNWKKKKELSRVCYDVIITGEASLSPSHMAIPEMCSFLNISFLWCFFFISIFIPKNNQILKTYIITHDPHVIAERLLLKIWNENKTIMTRSQRCKIFHG